MSSDSSEKCPAAVASAKAYFHSGAKPPEQQEQLPCPRCQSSNTKFCYYNNYNLSQPRYFCKSCRRYWTRGGTLRNVPVGGGTRKSSLKRSRAASSATTTTSTAATSPASSTLTHDPIRPDPNDDPVRPTPDVNLNQAFPVPVGFSSLLGGPQQIFGSFGGFGSGMRGAGYGLGPWDLPAFEGGAGGGLVGPTCNTWQGVEGGVGEGECFGWPDLAISTPGNGV